MLGSERFGAGVDMRKEKGFVRMMVLDWCSCEKYLR